MKLLFNESQWDKLKRMVEDNPDCIGVQLTSSEYIAIQDELVRTKDSNCVLMSQFVRQFSLYGRMIKVTVV